MGQVSTEEDVQRRADEALFMAGGMQPDLQQIYLASVEKPNPPVKEELSTTEVAAPKPRMSHLRYREGPRTADQGLRRANSMQKLWRAIRAAERKRLPIIVD